MLKLGVNIDHVATLRQARYRGRPEGEPDPVEAARWSEAAGAQGITAHLREDRRHMQDHDIERLRQVVTTRLNLEMANSPEIAAFALRLKPEVVCIVPEKRQEITTEGGLNAAAAQAELRDLRKQMNDAGIEVSLFITPELEQIDAAHFIGAQYIELHTGAYAEAFRDPSARAHELQRLIRASNHARNAQLNVNAGHGLNYDNVTALMQVPNLVELNIGHSIISRAVAVGLAEAVRQMVGLLKGYVQA
jgi:pyridoxine 5-phosphate synthase